MSTKADSESLEQQWKDRSEDGPVSAKKPRKVKERQRTEMRAREERDGGEVAADGGVLSEEK